MAMDSVEDGNPMSTPLEIAFHQKRPGELHPFAQFLFRRVARDLPETLAAEAYTIAFAAFAAYKKSDGILPRSIPFSFAKNCECEYVFTEFVQQCARGEIDFEEAA